VIRGARLVPSPDPALNRGLSQRDRHSRCGLRGPSTDSATRDTAKFLAANSSIRGLGNSRSNGCEDAHAASRGREGSGSDTVRIPLGPAKWVRCMPVRRLRGCIHHLAERPKTLVFSAFSGRLNISEHLPVSSEPKCPLPSLRRLHAASVTGCTAPRRFSRSRRNARGGMNHSGRYLASVRFFDRRRSCATCIESAASGCDAIDASPRF